MCFVVVVVVSIRIKKPSKSKILFWGGQIEAIYLRLNCPASSYAIKLRKMFNKKNKKGEETGQQQQQEQQQQQQQQQQRRLQLKRCAHSALPSCVCV